MSSINPPNCPKILKLWDKAGPIDVIQDAVKQRPGGCAYAAVGTHISYNLRIGYSDIIENRSVELPDGALVDYLKWEDELKLPSGTPNLVWHLLREAKENGVPLPNALKLQIDSHGFYPLPLVAQDMRHGLQSFTLLVVFEVRGDYSKHGEKPYMGRGKLIKDTNNQVYTHAVVVVGEYKDDSLFATGENIEPLWIYQNSDGDKDRSMLRNGLSVVRHGLILEAYYAETYPTSILLNPNFNALVEPLRRKPRVTI